MSALREERDSLVRLSDELKVEIRLKEDKSEGLNNELQDVLRKTKEGWFYFYVFKSSLLISLSIS